MKKADPELATPKMIMGAVFIVIGLSQILGASRPEFGVVECIVGAFILGTGIRLRMRARKNGRE